MLGSTTMSPLDHLADLAPERVRPLKRTEYETMVAAGSFADERVELLEGVIVEMSPQALLMRPPSSRSTGCSSA
jgi:hypothetical protein